MLTPSDRIRIIKEIAHRLGDEEWSLIDLTLKQFSLPYADTWTDTKEAYVIKMSENAPDEILINVARHVGLDYDIARPKVEPEFWLPNHFRLFISHLAKFRKQAAELQSFLRKYQITSFVAHNDIEPTTEWQNEIEAGLATCDGLVALLREGFHDSNWTDQEIGYAMGRGVLIIAISAEQDPYGFIGRFQALNGTGKDTGELARHIFDILRKNKQTRRRISEVLVSRLEQSGSYADAKEDMSLIEEVAYWDDSLSDRCKAAVKSNSQVRDAFGVPERIKHHINKWKS